VALNADAEPFEGFLEAEPPLDFDLWRDRWLSDLSGQQIPCQVVQAESPQMIHRVLFPAVIPSGGQAHVLVQDGPAPAASTDTDLAVSPLRLANQFLSVDLGAGGIVQVRTGGRPLLGEGGVHLHLRHDHSDTWTLGTDRFAGLVETLWQTDGWTVEETGPLRARVRAEGWIGHSRLRWTLSLQRHDPRLFLQIEVTFSERFRLLQLPVHLAEAPENHLDGLAGGAVARANDGMEWPLQGWSRVNLGDQHLAMVTNDAYSLSLDGAIWQWTLLRSPKMAWMGDDWAGGGTSLNTGRAWHTDQGAHNFAFVLHTGESLPPAALERSARQMGQPPIVFDRYDGIHRPPWGNKLPRHLGGPEQG
jgi:alpha-mannosidase